MAKKFRIKGNKDISKITPLNVIKAVKDNKYYYYPSNIPKQNALYITNLNKNSMSGRFVDDAGKIQVFDLNNRSQFKEFRNLVNEYRNDKNMYVPDYVSKAVEGQSKRLRNKFKHTNFRIKSGNRIDIKRNSPIQVHVEPNKEMSINAGWTDNDGFIGINGVINPNSPENNHLEAHYSNSGKFESFDFREDGKELEFDNLLKKDYNNGRDLPDLMINRIKRREKNGGFKISSNQPTNNRPTRRTTKQLDDGSIDYLFNGEKYKNISTNEHGDQLIRYYNRDGESYLTERKFSDGTSDTIRTLDKEGKKFAPGENKYRKILRKKDGSIIIKRGGYNTSFGGSLDKESVSRIRFDKNGERQYGYGRKDWKFSDNDGIDYFFNGEKYKNVRETESGTKITEYYNKDGKVYATDYNYNNGDFTRDYYDKDGNGKYIRTYKDDNGSIEIESGIKKDLIDEEEKSHIKIDKNGQRINVDSAETESQQNVNLESEKISEEERSRLLHEAKDKWNKNQYLPDPDNPGKFLKTNGFGYSVTEDENGKPVLDYSENARKRLKEAEEKRKAQSEQQSKKEPESQPQPQPESKPQPEPKPETKSTEDIFNNKLDKIEKLYNEGKLTDEQYTNALNNLYNSQKPEYVFNKKLDLIEKMYEKGKITDDEYADALNNLYDKERQRKKAESKQKTKSKPHSNPKPEPEPVFDPSKVDPNLHFNQPDYKKYQMHDSVFKEYKPTPLSSYDKRMKEYTDYIKEYEEMQELAKRTSLTSEEGARNYEKIKKFFGEDKFSQEEAALKYEEAKLYGPHRDNPNDPLRRNSKAWWEERDKLIKRRRLLNKNRQEFIDSERAAKELADSKFIREVSGHRDMRDLLRTQSPDYLNIPEITDAIKESSKWLENEDNINRYYGIPEEFRNKIEGDIKREKFEINKTRRNSKLDADYAKFESEYEKLTSLQKDEKKRLRELESKYRSWKRSNVRGKGQGDPQILKHIEKSKEKINDLNSQRKRVKKDMKRTSRKTRDRASNIKEEIKNIKNQLDDNEIFKNIQEAYEAEKKANPSLDFKQYLKDNYKNTRFENFNPKADYEIEQLKDNLQFHKDLLKEQAGIDIAKEEGDIVERVFGKLKKASKVDLAMSGIAAIGKYKDSRKEGRGVVSSTARAGVDFAASQLMGPALYMGLTAARVAPKLAVNGAMYLQNEVRQMNTASRFRVFGDASFQDNDNLATMRQSGMELAKMSNYNLEQTLMGNEARYLHR